MPRTLLFTSLVALGLASTLAAAAPKSVTSTVKKQAADEVRSEGRSLVANASSTSTRATVKTASGAAPTSAQVGDADTFGRAVIWDGLLSSGNISLAADCTPQPGDPPLGPNDRCVQLNAAPGSTSFDLPDIGQMWLPGKTSQNILCHWLTPIAIYSMYNGTGATANGRITLSPYLKIDSPVLNDPSLIDATTGLPFNGSLLTGFAASYSSQKTLAPGARDTERFSESRVCIAGTISRQGLIQGYGLTNAQVDAFFKNPLTLHFGLRGNASLVDFGNIIYGLRIMGD